MDLIQSQRCGKQKEKKIMITSLLPYHSITIEYHYRPLQQPCGTVGLSDFLSCRSNDSVHLQTALSKLLTYRMLTSTQPPTQAGQEMTNSLFNADCIRDEGLMWLTETAICLLTTGNERCIARPRLYTALLVTVLTRRITGLALRLSMPKLSFIVQQCTE